MKVNTATDPFARVLLAICLSLAIGACAARDASNAADGSAATAGVSMAAEALQPGAPGSRGSRPPGFVAADCHGSACFSPNLLKAKKRDRTGTPPPKNFYRCPACGEMVDNTDRESVGLHHDHVLHPPFYRFAILPMPPATKIRASDSAGVNRPISDKRVRERSESQRARILRSYSHDGETYR